MLNLNGKYNNAIIFTDNIDNASISQIIETCNQESCRESKIRIMPDVHAGTGCTIGTTMTIHDKVIPSLVGVDIGCGMFVTKLKDKNIDLALLDEVIRKHIPSGQNVNDKINKNANKINYKDLIAYKHINEDRAAKSIGTLGGGNHFIELNKDNDNNLYLVIHSGSRYLGKQVFDYHQNIAINRINKKKQQEIISKLKQEGREKEIQQVLTSMSQPKIPKNYRYLDGTDLDNYINDMKITQKYAEINRETMASIIINKLGLTVDYQFHTIHNYLDIPDSKDKDIILRKGAIRANKDEIVLIPLNMRDGSILAKGKGNSEWNYSAPHGAGRIMSRSQAKELIAIEEFKNSMKDVYTTSVCEATIDEVPMAYKPKEDIINNITDTVEIIDIITPIYNYKAN